MRRGNDEDDEFERLRRQFDDLLGGADQDLTATGRSIFGGGRPGRAVSRSYFGGLPPVDDVFEQRSRSVVPSAVRPWHGWRRGQRRLGRDRTPPTPLHLVLLTAANSVTAGAALATGATAIGLISCTAVSVGTICLATVHFRRSRRRD